MTHNCSTSILRYVWVQSGGGWVFVNLELLRKGLATVTTYPPDVKYVDSLYLPAQRATQAARCCPNGLTECLPPMGDAHDNHDQPLRDETPWLKPCRWRWSSAMRATVTTPQVTAP